MLKEIFYPPKKAFKKKIKYYTGKDKFPSFKNFFRMPKVNNSNLSNEKQKELKIKLGQLQEEISKAPLPVSADLSNDFKSVIFETDQRKIWLGGYFGRSSKNIYNLPKIMPHITP